MLNFKFVPPHQRVLAVNVCAILWNSYLRWVCLLCVCVSCVSVSCVGGLAAVLGSSAPEMLEHLRAEGFVL